MSAELHHWLQHGGTFHVHCHGLNGQHCTLLLNISPMKIAVQHGIKHVVALLEVGCQMLFDTGVHSPSLVHSLQSRTQQVIPMSMHKARRRLWPAVL